MTVIGRDVECPMLSPDGTRLAYKVRRIDRGRISWGLGVMHLATRDVTDLNERRNVDDQPEWLDDDHIIYALPVEGTASSNVWIASATGESDPHLFIPDAFSPSIVRTPVLN
jgi:Tol biopolymer transport system component